MKKGTNIKGSLPIALGVAAIVLSVFWAMTTKQSGKIPVVPEVLGHREGCLTCHQAMAGFSPAHSPEAIGCAACHLGDPFNLDKDVAHKGVVLIPGNLDVAKRTCGTSDCHPQLATNIQTSLMATGRGLVTVDRFVFGEADSPNASGHLSELRHSPADDHLRKLCASCHLSNVKDLPEPIDELSRGGGCTACHLHYSSKAKEDLAAYNQSGDLPTTHPALTIQVTDDHCFGCHSRSGRISTNYEGWHETDLTPQQKPDTGNFRQLQDGRVFRKETADVHFQKGLACIDCHTWRETMGDGQAHNHQEEQVEISCEDCHRLAPPQTVGRETLNEIDGKILQQRKWPPKDGTSILTKKTQHPLLNVQMDKTGRVIVKEKNSGQTHIAKSPAPICTTRIKGHERLSCQSCHTAWAPQCISCHTEFDAQQKATDHLTNKKTKGRWVEYSGEMFADPPVLGIRRSNGGEIIDTFIPGMIVTINTEKVSDTQPGETYQIFRRLYAPTAAHTTVTKGRKCHSCHSDALALGFGRGRLVYEKTASGKGRWSFAPTYGTHPADNLPFDAWTGFMQERTGAASTRIGAHPFSVDEQQKILQVGACLTCHPSDAKNIKRIYADFQSALENVSVECVLPVWKQ